MMRQLRFIFITLISFLFVTSAVSLRRTVSVLLCGVLSFNSVSCYSFVDKYGKADAAAPPSSAVETSKDFSVVQKDEQKIADCFLGVCVKVPKSPIPIPGVPDGDPLGLAKAAIVKQIGEAVGVGSPLLLDQKTAYPDVSDQVKDFHPKKLTVTSAEDLQKPLPPGDYSLDVIAYCTQFSIHAPGRGLPYKLAPLKGKQAPAISALLSRGTLQGIAPATLNANAWRIQAGLPLKQWSSQDQALIHKLIPEYEKGLEGDYLQQIENTYNQYRLVPGIPSLNDLLKQAGAPGQTVLQLRQARQALTNQTISAERLPDMLYEPTGDGLPRVLPASKESSPSHWAEVKPGVFARFTVIEGHLGRNLFEFRVTPKASAAINNSNTVVAQNMGKSLQIGEVTTTALTLAQVLGGNDSPYSLDQQTLLLIGYSISRPSQALISVADIIRNTSDPKPEVGDIVIYRNGGITHSGVITAVRPDGTVTQVESKWGAQGLYLHDPNDSIYGRSWTVYRAKRKDGSASNFLKSAQKNCVIDSPVRICNRYYYTDAEYEVGEYVYKGNHWLNRTFFNWAIPGEKEEVKNYLDNHKKVQEVEPPNTGYNCHGFTFTNGEVYIDVRNNAVIVERILHDNGYFQIKALDTEGKTH